MKALIAFIVMAVLILTLIEINERVKAKRKKEECTKEPSSKEDCADCSLIELCEKKPSK